MSRTLYLPVFLLTTVALAAQTAPPPAPTPDGAPVLLDRMVVSDKLDKAREDIVPSLGATEFRIDRAQIDALALGAAAGFNEVLLHVPGVAQDSFGQVHVRGEHANLQYRINDVLLPEGLTGFGSELDTRFVDTVNVLTGALPAQYGYRTSGVVDIHTRSSTHDTGDVSHYGGSFGTRRASAEATASQDRLAGYVTASDEQSGLGVENPTAARAAIHDHKDQFKTFALFSYVIDDSSRMSLMLSASFARFQIPNNPGQAPAFTLQGVPTFASANLDENQHEQNHYAIVAYQKSTGAMSVQVSAFTRYSQVVFSPDRNGDLIFNGVASDVRRAIVGTGLEADFMVPLAAAHTLRAGAILTSTNAGTSTSTAVFATDSAGNQASAVPFDIAASQSKLGWLFGVYGQDEWNPLSGLTINFGARADASRSYTNENQLSPRLNFVYKLDETAALHAGYARYFTPPPLELVQTATIGKFTGTTNEPTVATSSPVLAERSNYFDAGLSLKLSPNFTAGIDAYYKHAENLLDEGQFGAALIFSPFNYRKGRIYGVELSGNYSHEGFSAYVNAALSEATGRNIVSGEFQFDPAELTYIATHDVHLDHDQRYTLSAGTSYKLGDTLAYADFLSGSGLRRGFANTAHLAAYHPLNVGLDHAFKFSAHREVHARLDVVNVFDKTYELRDGSGIGVGAPQFGSRRGCYGTLSWNF